jgi:hypothetical protein
VPKIFGEFIKHGSLFTRLDAMPFGVEPVEGVYLRKREAGFHEMSIDVAGRG